MNIYAKPAQAPDPAAIEPDRGQLAEVLGPDASGMFWAGLADGRRLGPYPASHEALKAVVHATGCHDEFYTDNNPGRQRFLRK